MNTFMQNIYTFGGIVLVISYMIMILSSFHKKFIVLYDNFGKGLGLELLTSFIVSVILAALTFAFWPVVVIAIGIIVFFKIRKFNDWFHRLIWIISASILSTFVMVMGIISWIGKV